LRQLIQTSSLYINKRHKIIFYNLKINYIKKKILSDRDRFFSRNIAVAKVLIIIMLNVMRNHVQLTTRVELKRVTNIIVVDISAIITDR